MSDPTAQRSRLPLKLDAYGSVDIGRRRKHNEDAVLLRPDLLVYVLADGAGGHNAGNVASALATTSVANFFETTEAAMAGAPDVDRFGLSKGERRLAAAIQRANRDIVDISKTSNKHKGMGTTIVAISVTVDHGVMHVAHVGDSRCYRWRAGELEQLTYDHSLINDVLETRPEVDDMALERLPPNVVTRALGMEDRVRVSVRSFRMLTGDRYLLCSDGLTDELDDDQLAEVLKLEKPAEDVVHLLIDMANQSGGEDNIGALVIRCEVAPSSPSSSWPRRRTSVHPRPEMTTLIDAAEGDARDADPEIVIVGVEHAPDVVPAGSANRELLDALEALKFAKE
jgi:serine/threonine protein phosphatase PrpC